jgi:hypothetical protein
LGEAGKRTGLARKVIIRKLCHPAQLVDTVRSQPRRRRYDTAVRTALAELWELFDYRCGQRLAPLLREQVPRLRARQEWTCREEVATKLLTISAKSIDRLLAQERQRRRLPRYRHTRSAVCCWRKFPSKWPAIGIALRWAICSLIMWLIAASPPLAVISGPSPWSTSPQAGGKVK